MPSNKKNLPGSPSDDIHLSVFLELVTYITEVSSASNGQDPVVFKLEDLVSFYEQRLLQLGAKSPVIHSTSLKEKLLSSIIELEEHKKGRDVLLSFSNDTGYVLAVANRHKDDEAIYLTNAANII